MWNHYLNESLLFNQTIMHIDKNSILGKLQTSLITEKLAPKSVLFNNNLTVWTQI